jgi:hypothetical protein
MERFTGLKVFSTTLARDRDQMGESITRWLAANPELEVVDRVVLQSSDKEFHCLSIVVFYREKGTG